MTKTLEQKTIGLDPQRMCLVGEGLRPSLTVALRENGKSWYVVDVLNPQGETLTRVYESEIPSRARKCYECVVDELEGGDHELSVRLSVWKVTIPLNASSERLGEIEKANIGEREMNFLINSTQGEIYANGGIDGSGFTARDRTRMFEQSCLANIAASYGWRRAVGFSRAIALEAAKRVLAENSNIGSEYELTKVFPEDERPDVDLFPPTTKRVEQVVDSTRRVDCPPEVEAELIKNAGWNYRRARGSDELLYSHHPFNDSLIDFERVSGTLLREEIYDKIEAAANSPRKTRRKTNQK